MNFIEKISLDVTHIAGIYDSEQFRENYYKGYRLLVVLTLVPQCLGFVLRSPAIIILSDVVRPFIDMKQKGFNRSNI